MENLIMDAALGAAGGYVDNMIGGIIDQFFGILVVVYLPFFLYGVIQCFFGNKIYRIVLTISGAFVGMLIGAILGLLIFKAAPGAVICGILGAVGGGCFAWFFYRFCTSMKALFFVMGILSTPLMIMTKNLVLGIVIGLIAGIVAAVYAWKYLNLAIVLLTACSGAVLIGTFISLLFKGGTAGNVIGILVGLACAVLGYMYQTKNPALGRFSIGGKQIKYIDETPSSQQSQTVKLQLVGIEGRYKGFEFDIDSETTFGRDEEKCNIIFPKESNGVSRVQCTVVINADGRSLSVCDKYSSYGTSVNGRKLANGEVANLNDGDIVLFGENNVFKVQYIGV